MGESSSSSGDESKPDIDVDAPQVAVAVLTPKDASHTAFYAGFAKGAGAAIEGLLLFLQTPKLQQIAINALGPMLKAQFLYISAGVILVIVLHDMQFDFYELFWTISKWGRLMTILLNIFGIFQNTKDDMFFTALHEKNEDFAKAIEELPPVRASFHHRWLNFKRIAKLALFKTAGTFIKWIIPGGKFVAIPAMKFVSMRPVLGTGVAIAVSAVHAIPSETLESSKVDDALVVFGESVVDADDLGTDLTKKFTRRLDEDTRSYFSSRYRGYVVGCGVVYGLLSAVPLLGIPMSLIGECGAACLVSDIVQRNLEKENRRPFPGEDFLRRPKTS